MLRELGIQFVLQEWTKAAEAAKGMQRSPATNSLEMLLPVVSTNLLSILK